MVTIRSVAKWAVGVLVSTLIVLQPVLDLIVAEWKLLLQLLGAIVVVGLFWSQSRQVKEAAAAVERKAKTVEEAADKVLAEQSRLAKIEAEKHRESAEERARRIAGRPR